MSQKRIEVHYKQGNTNLKANAISFQIDYPEFFKRHLLNDMQMGDLPGFVDIPTFQQLLKQVLKVHPQHAVAQQVLDNLDSIEQDMHQRIVQIQELPLEFNTTFKSPHPEYLERITKMNDIVDRRISKQSQSWQLLYVVQTTLISTINGQPFTVIKLGKTKYPIDAYVNTLKTNYEKKIHFKPLFARRMYCPEHTDIDKKPFHNKLINLVPGSKIFLRSSPNAKNQRSYRVEFYILTEEFITNFEQCLKDFMEQHEEEYVNYEKQQVELSDEVSAFQQSNLSAQEDEEIEEDEELEDDDDTEQIIGSKGGSSIINSVISQPEQQSREQSIITQIQVNEELDNVEPEDNQSGIYDLCPQLNDSVCSIVQNSQIQQNAIPPKLSYQGLLKVQRILNYSGGKPVPNIIKKMLLIKQMKLDTENRNPIPVPAQ